MVAATASAPRVARQVLDGRLAYLGEETQEQARLAISEVVSNAVRHGNLRPDQAVTITIEGHERSARVSVAQPTRADARLRPDGDHLDGGIGLQIVSAVVDRWGVEAGPPGIVWFEVSASNGDR